MIKNTIKYVFSKRNRLVAVANRAKSKAVLEATTAALKVASFDTRSYEAIETIRWGYSATYDPIGFDSEATVAEGRIDGIQIVWILEWFPEKEHIPGPHIK